MAELTERDSSSAGPFADKPQMSDLSVLYGYLGYFS
jgi:hypothetical protein